MKNGFMLKNSFDSIIMRHNLMRNEDFETIEQCENVADRYAVEFLIWVRENTIFEYLTKEFIYNKQVYKSEKELLEIFKKLNNNDTRRKI